MDSYIPVEVKHPVNIYYLYLLYYTMIITSKLFFLKGNHVQTLSNINGFNCRYKKLVRTKQRSGSLITSFSFPARSAPCETNRLPQNIYP